MRIISGKYKGKRLKGYDIIGTRPTMGRVKESLFAMIQNKLKNSVVLDLFAGTGSLGIEAISNGSSFCYFVEKNLEIFKKLTDNLSDIDKKNYKILKYDYQESLNYFYNNNIKFDLIFLDPPYNLNLINKTLDIIYKLNLLNSNGLIICEYETEKVETEKFTLIKNKKYGNKYIKIYENIC